MLQLNYSRSKIGASVEKMCSNASEKVEALCSESSLNTCGDCGRTTTQKYVEILEFTHFTEFWTFNEVGVLNLHWLCGF